MNTFVYEIDGRDYINLTNRCTNNCSFCLRNSYDGMGDYNLWIDREPEASEIIDIIKYRKKDVVFCGYGEPTIKIEELIEVSKYVKSYGGRVRVNTNGHANHYHGYNVVPLLSSYVDVFSVSLNAPDGTKYDELCKSIYGENGFDYVLDFVKSCRKEKIHVVLSVLDLLNTGDIEKCKKIASELDAEFRIRKHF